MRTAFHLFAFTLTLASIASPVRAQRSDGLTATVVGNPYGFYGEPYHLSGTAFAVQGLADLRGLGGGEVKLELLDRQGREVRTVTETRARTGGDGRFELTLGIPEERALANPALRLTVSRGRESRTFHHAIQLRSPIAFDLLTDRQRYEPGETVHVWARVRRHRDGAPVAGGTVQVSVVEPGGARAFDQRVQANEGGVVAVEVPLEAGAREGGYQVVARSDDSVATSQSFAAFEVARRTVERLFVDVELDDPIVAPGGQLRGTIRVSTPSGTPVAGAAVVVTGNGMETLTLQSGDDGTVALRIAAPSYLAGDMAPGALAVRVEHPAHGALHTAASFMLSRVRWRVQATAEAGGLVPGVATEAYFSVTNARGEPPPEGTGVRVRGPGVRGELRGTLDAHGLVAFPVQVGPGDYGLVPSPSGLGGGPQGVQLEVSLQTDPPAFSKVFVPVSPDAELLVRVEEPFAAPGGEVAFALERPAGRGEVLVEAFLGDRLVATTRVDGSRGVLRLPEAIGGVVEVRARPVTAVARPNPLDERGLVAHGVGSSAAVVVRPADAFALTLSPGQDPYLVRDEAQVQAQLSQASPKAWIAFVARDLAAHGGEGPWSLEWLGRSLDRALVSPQEGDGVLIRSSLAALVQPDTAAPRARPVVVPPWGLPDEGPTRQRPEVLRDALAGRAELLRRGAAATMVALERAVAQRVGNRELLEQLLEQRGSRWVFRTDAPERANIHMENLGGAQITVPMLRSADSGFSFDAVARRVARTELVKLLGALRALSNPQDLSAARAVAGQPPERWLSRLVELGALQRADLIDPWGRPFTFRRSARPALVFSAEAAEWELASAGPDGRMGTADDVRDPFARILERGSPYAVASGEDQLLLRLSALSPGPQTLAQMAQAYAAMSLAAAQERTRGPVTGTVSEADGDYALADDGVADESMVAGELLDVAQGYGRGGGGASASRTRSAPRAPAAEPEAAEEALEDAAPSRDARNAREQAQSPIAAMGNRIREKFPATLHVEPGRPLDGTSATLSFQLADALTTYRVEAIAWTASGWTTTARTEVRVDQQATVDAPVPPFATVGDVVRLPIRVDNRSGEPLRARLEIEGEGVRLELGELESLEIPARRGRELVVPVTLPEVGEGHVVVRAVTADGTPLDAVRRPLRVWADARVVRQTVRSVVEGDGEVALELPEDASPRGPAELRVVAGGGLFGPLDQKGLDGAWAMAVLGRAAPESALLAARRLLRASDPRPDLRIGLPPYQGALALGVLWTDGATDDPALERALRLVADRTPTGDDPGSLRMAAEVLRALAPTGGRRPALTELRGALVERLVDQLAAAVRSDDPDLLAACAAALALTEEGDARAQAEELLRRLRRAEVRFDDRSFLESPRAQGTPEGRLRPSANAALALAALEERERALRFVRHLVDLPATDAAASSVAAAAAGLLGGTGAARVRVTLDGRVIELSGAAPVRSASFPTPGPGDHALRVETESVALLVVDLRYARPWSAAPQREARFEASIEGELGARDVRAALALTVRSRQPRLVRAPVAYVDLPAGAELDQPTREALEGVGARPTMEGRTLRIELPALGPGRRVRLPLPLRWSVGGTLRGLGITVVDEGESRAGIRPATIVPSRELSIPDAGPEPESPEAELPAPDAPPPPPPVLHRLAPVALHPSAPSSSLEVLA